ncbi:MAG: hypothetical protein KAS32_13910 [Candidatus Peribacteraceae bacterium]|nr:hypothetical protein [Candidatus Peribacteraceae bacterium]
MTDDWSLKDRVVIDKQVEPNESWFAKSTIDILRKKLIENIKTDVEVYNREYLLKVAIEREINKLFGVDK